jgi:hypothetical protein
MLPPSIEEVAALDAELASFELPFKPITPNELLKRFDAAREGGELTIV